MDHFHDGMSEQTEKPQWYSIKAAAAYLEVGEPTLYRWMRDGKITYRKVGDSTRFLQEDLDAVVQVHPSSKDVTRVQTFCSVCHHDQLVDGHIESIGLAYFRPDNVKFWTLKDPNIKTTARMCTRCGALTMFGDMEKLQKLNTARKKEKEAEEGDSTDESSD